MSYMLFAIIVLLLYLMYKREEQYKEERKDYLDRLMAKDFVEYKEQAEHVQYEPVVLTEEEEYYREIEEQKV